MRLQGKTIVITGAGSGLGRESAVLFAEEGANVVVTDKMDKRVHDVVAEVQKAGGRAVGLRADVTSEEDMNAAVELAVAEFGRLVVLTGVFLSAKAAVRAFKRQGRGGNIVVTGSAGGIVGYPGFFSYGAGKAGAHHLVKSIAQDLRKYGIRANALAPTHGMSINFAMPLDAEVLGLSYEQAAAAEQGGWNADASPIPLKLDSPPNLRDNANVALFLASDESRYMSGVVLPATDGGTLSKVAMYFEDSWEQDLVTEDAEKAAGV
jgi:NAD(P)-dependent dehydrogenase (short-subunit alcohol dehydrogenase family)